MVNHVKFAYRIGLAVFFILLLSGVGLGAEQGVGEPADADANFLLDPAEENVLPETQELVPAMVETHTLTDAYAGYRFVGVNRYGGRAAEYDYLHSNPVLGGQVNYLGPASKFSLEGGYLNDKDFHGDLTYDFKGIYRFTLRTESLFHNLDHELLFSPPFTLGSTLESNTYTPIDIDPAALYGVRVEQDLARFRYKFRWFPVHLNLGYWRMVKEGTAEQRFADHAFGGTGASNTIYSRTRVIDRQTHEGQFGADTHLGPVDLIYDFRIREFGEHAATPRDFFIARQDPDLVMRRDAGSFEHNENPDSRFYAHTIRLHTSMSGGIVGAASYTYGRRENLSNLTDFKGADRTSDIIHNIAGDFTFTPCRSFSAALKYRRQDLERSGLAALSSTVAVDPAVISVRQALDTQKDVITATFSYRPTTLLTLKGEYKGEFLSRDNLPPWVRPGEISTLNFPGHSATHTGSLSVLSKPLKGLKLKSEYKYSTSDSPAYANAYEEKHEGAAQASYNAPNRWGVTAGTRISRENSDNLTIATLNDPSVVQQLSRKRTATNGTISLWVVPVQKLTVSGSYSLLRSSTDQAVLLASFLPASTTLTNYISQAQIYTVTGTYHYDERLDLSLALQQVRSYAEFDPQFKSVPNPGNPPASINTGGVKEISRLKTVESTLSARADYRFARNLSCALEYAFKDYDEKSSSLFNGSVNSAMLYLASKW